MKLVRFLIVGGIALGWAAAMTTSTLKAADPWLRVTAPDFTLITALKQKDAVAWAEDFAQFVEALGQVIPVNKQRLPRLTVVVFARDKDFAGYRPLDDEGKTKAVGGFFSRRESWAVAGMSGVSMGEETRPIIFHEGTHWFLSAFELPNPVWLEEGLAEVFSTFTVDAKTYTWGKGVDAHVYLLNVQKPMPLERVMFLTNGDLFRGGSEGELRTGLAYAQSWAFVHYLIFGQRELPPAALSNYVRLYRTAINPDAAFQKAFGLTYVEMDKRLVSYVHGGRYMKSKRPRNPAPVLDVKPATTFDVEDALARLSLAALRGGEALAHATKAQASEPESPRVYELLGQIYEETKEPEKARDAYAKAVEKGTNDFRPYFELGWTEYSKARENGGPGPEEARKIANRYERSINLNPRFQPSYRNLAGLMDLVPPGNPEDRAFLELGVKLYPDDGLIRIGLALVAKKNGDESIAQSLLENVLNPVTPQPPDTIAFARRLDVAWRQKATSDRLKTLIDEKKYAEAVAWIDAQLPSINDAMFRRYLTTTRAQLSVSARFEEARVASEEHRWMDARKILAEIAESDAPPGIRSQARVKLADMDRRKLGLPK